MIKMLLALVALALCVLGASKACYAAVEPDNVAAVLSRAADECRQMGGRPNTDAMLSVNDLNGDGGEDWILDFSKLACEGSTNPFCGSGGCSLQIFLWSSGSTWKSVFDDVVQRYRLMRVQGRRGIEMTFGGSACGRTNARPCRRLYIFGRTGLTPAR
jgi:hypothetical protein